MHVSKNDVLFLKVVREAMPYKFCTKLGSVLAKIWDRWSLPNPYITIIPGDGSLRIASRNPDPKPSNSIGKKNWKTTL